MCIRGHRKMTSAWLGEMIDMPRCLLDSSGKYTARHPRARMIGVGLTRDEALADFWARVQGRYEKLLEFGLGAHTFDSYTEFQFLGRMLNAIE